MFRPIGLIILFFLTYVQVTACSCIAIPSFCETLSFYDFSGKDSTSIIVRAKLEKHHPDRAEIKVLDWLKGPVTDQYLDVLSGDGANCRSFMDQFKKGTEWIFILNPITYESHTSLKYGLSICGVTFLEVRNNRVKGPITGGVSDLSYPEFLELSECTQFNTQFQDITLLKNPIGQYLNIQFNFAQSAQVQVTGMDVIGRHLWSDTINIPGNNSLWVESFDTSRLPLGIIYVKLSGIHEERVYKVIKAN